MAVIETVEHTFEEWQGKQLPITITHRVGLHTYTCNGESFLVDEVTTTDYGPRQGVTTRIVQHHDYTPEERAEGRRRIREVATQALIDQGIW